jgi:hypothetical protein
MRDEEKDSCPGRVDMGAAGCNQCGPKFDLSFWGSGDGQSAIPTGDPNLSIQAKALTTAPGLCVFKMAHDFDGHDFEEFSNVKTIEACGQLCLANPQCHFFTRTKWNGCYLKSIKAGYTAGRAVPWADTGRCVRSPTPAPPTAAPPTQPPATTEPTTAEPTTTQLPTTTPALSTLEPELRLGPTTTATTDAEDDSAALALLKAALSAAEDASARHQAEKADLVAENERLRATIDAIRVLVA